jgi:hypothetical protein
VPVSVSVSVSVCLSICLSVCVRERECVCKGFSRAIRGDADTRVFVLRLS